jgi:hypothetical protein
MLLNSSFFKLIFIENPNCEGPYKVIGIVPENAYFVEPLEGKELPKAINGRYLKAYFPSVWQGA